MTARPASSQALTVSSRTADLALGRAGRNVGRRDSELAICAPASEGWLRSAIDGRSLTALQLVSQSMAAWRQQPDMRARSITQPNRAIKRITTSADALQAGTETAQPPGSYHPAHPLATSGLSPHLSHPGDSGGFDVSRAWCSGVANDPAGVFQPANASTNKTGQPDRLQQSPGHRGAPAISPGQAGNLLSKRPPHTVHSWAEEPPYRQVDDHRLPDHRRIVQVPLIAAGGAGNSPGNARPRSRRSPGWSARWLGVGAELALAACAGCGDGGERHDARLGRAVVGLADSAKQAGARGRVDDPPPHSAPPLSAPNSPRAVWPQDTGDDQARLHVLAFGTGVSGQSSRRRGRLRQGRLLLDKSSKSAYYRKQRMRAER